MKYVISTFICVLILPVMVFTMCSSNTVRNVDSIENSDFQYEYEKIDLSDIISESKPENIVSKPQPPKWKHVNYGGHIYAVDEKGLYHDRQGRVWKPIKVDTTAYTWRDDGDNPRIGAGDGKTCTNKNAITTYGIASGSPVVPLGSKLHVSGYGIFDVDDTGGKLRREWRRKKVTLLDLRIPQKRYDGVWRSVSRARAIALKHGRRRNRIVLILIKS